MLSIKFIPDPNWPDPDPKWFIPGPNPDPAKSSGSDRIRIHNTVNPGKIRIWNPVWKNISDLQRWNKKLKNTWMRWRVLRIQTKSFGSCVGSGFGLKLVSDPNPGFESGSKSRIQIRIRILDSDLDHKLDNLFFCSKIFESGSESGSETFISVPDPQHCWWIQIRIRTTGFRYNLVNFF